MTELFSCFFVRGFVNLSITRTLYHVRAGGYTLTQAIHLADIVPTICHLAEWPVPKGAEGAILYQALENPDAKNDELRRPRENYERLKRVVESEQAETHRYYQE